MKHWGHFDTMRASYVTLGLDLCWRLSAALCTFSNLFHYLMPRYSSSVRWEARPINCREKSSKGKRGGDYSEASPDRASNLSLFLPILSDNMKCRHLTVTIGIERAIAATYNWPGSIEFPRRVFRATHRGVSWHDIMSRDDMERRLKSRCVMRSLEWVRWNVHDKEPTQGCSNMRGLQFRDEWGGISIPPHVMVEMCHSGFSSS
jgi:hypothetical protein